MTLQELPALIRQKKSYLCVGLDPDINKLPQGFEKNPKGVLEFCKAIIEATEPYAIAYKPNAAFFEALGPQGFEIAHQVMELIPDSCFKIWDAKRGDIGNTSAAYAKSAYQFLKADCITVAPYMGADSIQPFLQEGKSIALLGLTSNPGAQDFELLKLENGRFLFEEVMLKTAQWASEEQLMFVVGATQSGQIQSIRNLIPNHFLLVPGIGAQGGDLKSTLLAGRNNKEGLLINASRSILYASSGPDFAQAAATEAKKLQSEMASLAGF